MSAPTATSRALSAPAHTLATETVIAELNTASELGLDEMDARSRLASVGPNQLREEPRIPAWRRFVAQFQDFMIYVLLAAVLIAALQGDALEAGAILAILLLNGVLGFMQESRAQDALDALNQLAAPVATVIRGGVERDIPAADLVPGDIVLLEAGDRVPADGRVLDAAALRVMESALTGESAAVTKDPSVVSDPVTALGERYDMVFASTAVAVGRGRYVVTATGEDTEVGRIADLLAGTEQEQTPLQRELDRVGRRIAIIVLAIAAVIFAEEAAVAWRTLSEPSLAVALGDRAFRVAVTDGLLVAVSLAVAAIPEGLPAIVTVSLSLGVRRMAERNALVRRLHAVETLGSTTFICSDKTGTLTRNVMSVQRLLVGLDSVAVTVGDDGSSAQLAPAAAAPDDADLRLLLETAAANNDAHVTAEGQMVGDPTETALLIAAEQFAPDSPRYERVAEVPFDSRRKRMTTVHDVDGTHVAYVKGGADVVLALCTRARLHGVTVALDPALRERILRLNAGFAEAGLRTLAFATRDLSGTALLGDPAILGEQIESELTYVGVVGLADPPRPEVRDALVECRRAGIRVAMITGDHALTARAIAREIGLAEDPVVVTGPELEATSDEDLDYVVESARVYARVDPTHKLRIVDALKRNGEIVAMTGDGVNDAPALKRADIGVAMGDVGTDVARESADMVLADDDFATIVHAVEQGRTVFDNLRKVILFLLSCNTSEVLVVFVTALFSPTAALLPLQLLWINLITDGLPALALGVDPAEPGVMDRPPRDAEESILSAKRQLQILWQGVVMTAVALVLYYVVAPQMPGVTPFVDRTMLLCGLVLTQLLHAFDFRNARGTVWHPRSLENRWLLLALVGSMTLQVLVTTVPALQAVFQTTALSPAQWLAVVVAALLGIAVIDASTLVETAWSVRRTRSVR